MTKIGKSVLTKRSSSVSTVNLTKDHYKILTLLKAKGGRASANFANNFDLLDMLELQELGLIKTIESPPGYLGKRWIKGYRLTNKGKALLKG